MVTEATGGLDKKKDEEESLRLQKEKGELENKKLKNEIMKIKLGSVVTILSILTGLGAFYLQSSKYLSQQKEENDFKVNKELVILVKQLSSEEPKESENAALLLSTFNEPAVPLLLRNLVWADDPTAIIESLGLILKEVEKPNKVFAIITDFANNLFNNEAVKDGTNMRYKVVVNCVKALGELGNYDKDGVAKILIKLDMDLKNNLEADANYKEEVVNEINKSKEKLGI